MAGIGFELKRIYAKKTLAASFWGTVYATMITIGPAVLSTVMMLSLKLLLDQAGLTILEGRFFISASTYAFLMATLVSALFCTPVSRFISDCIYLDKTSDICSSVFGVLTLTTAISGVIMALLCARLHGSGDGISPAFLTAYYFLGVLIADSYSMMTYASALKHYRELTFSFFLGLALAIGIFFLCTRLETDRVTSACIALACCYFMIVFILVVQCMKTFGVPQGRHFAFLPYFRRYPKLAVGGMAYTLGLYCPTIIYWFFSDMAEQVSIFLTTPSYDLSMFWAITVNMPSLVIFVVKVETAFYEKYTLYVSALNHGTYGMIEKERSGMIRELCAQLFFVYEFQLVITLVLVCLISVFFPYLNASIHMLSLFILLSLGVYATLCMYFTTIVFYYFADYGGACAASLIFLSVTALSAVAAVVKNDFYPLPLLLGGLCGWAASFLLLRRRMRNLDRFLMC